MERVSDSQLVRAARGGSRKAGEELFRRYWPAAWRIAYGLTGRRAMADDIAQDAFERAFAALARFDERRPFAPWLHRIVTNRALDLLRSERRLVGSDVDFEGLGSVELESGDRELLERVASLSHQRRAVVVLRYGVGLSPAEIAGVLDLPIGTVNSRLARALEQLRAESEVTDAR